MPKALVLIDTNVYSAKEVLQELKACKEVKEAFMVSGVYDIVAKVEGETINDLVDIINRRVRRLFQVRETLSMLIIEPKKSMQEQENGVIVV